MNVNCATNKGHRNQTHLFPECSQPLKIIQRQAYWNGIQTYNQSLHDYMSNLKPNQAIRLATGLTKLNSHENNEFLIRDASMDLCNLCYYPSSKGVE